MRSKIAFVLLLAVFALSGMSQEVSAATPLRLSLLPGISIPGDNVVIGIDIGLIADSVQEVNGFQVSWLYSGTDRLSGIQLGLVNISNSATGIQWGLYNQSQSFVGIQIGLINVTDTMHGFQIGLINIIRTGAPFPFMVFINGNF
ncbi:MAG: hypothetical protein A2452_00760 [Candidatus Firestonebacteria bacterium RIFOXYC2_FULL_39_67]|nr:MAG: hypothetical protein A2536_06310 [Candidatus Firestonebacteria bacterium RIFOXYD2_FULL_39_29]OGF56083.1 MAG: hypothetical protein A2452_00760 [Candidatus Firestonebacteria bacterium RIFOXYC2_FULL_39_67]OGF56464.1 MAG: hypothetical protein A2497_08255 [Candidatus Firestonebacteria bacterium RifOxyC12_full_39_7]